MSNIKTNQPTGREVHIDTSTVDPVTRINPQLLRSQRALLMKLFERVESDDQAFRDGLLVDRLVDTDEIHLLEGVISFLDCIADYAHDKYHIYGCLFNDEETCCELHVAEFEQEKALSSPLVS